MARLSQPGVSAPKRTVVAARDACVAAGSAPSGGGQMLGARKVKAVAWLLSAPRQTVSIGTLAAAAQARALRALFSRSHGRAAASRPAGSARLRRPCHCVGRARNCSLRSAV
jgi:hypothetical protein